MKEFLAFVRKEFYHIFRDWRTMLIVLGTPVVEIVLFGFALTTEVKNGKVAVIDYSNSPEARSILARIDASDYFDITATCRNADELDELFRHNKVQLGIVIEPDFAKAVYSHLPGKIQLIADASDPNYATLLAQYASRILSDYARSLPSTHIDTQVHIVPHAKLLYNPDMKSAYFFVPGVMGLVLMLICAMMTSLSIVREKETGTMEVLLASPVKPNYIIWAKTIPYFTLSCMNLLTILLLSTFMLKVPIVGSLFWLVALSILFILVALMLGILTSNVAHNQVEAMLFSGMVLMFPTVVLSGMIFPVSSMPWLLQWVSYCLPATWYISGVKKIMIEGLPLLYVWKEFTVLLGMVLVLTVLSVLKFNKRLE